MAHPGVGVGSKRLSSQMSRDVRNVCIDVEAPHEHEILGNHMGHARCHSQTFPRHSICSIIIALLVTFGKEASQWKVICNGKTQSKVCQ